MFKKIFSFLTIAIALGLIGVSTIRANTYEVDDNIVSDYNSTVHFNQNGNDFDWMIWRAWDTTVTPWEVVDLSGVQKTCMKQLKWYYYNNQRGTRVRPLDSDSLEVLSGLDSSYANLTLAGWLRRACSWENQWNVYGQVTHTYNGDTFKLLAWVEYNFVSWTYLGTFSGNMEYKNIFNKYSANW